MTKNPKKRLPQNCLLKHNRKEQKRLVSFLPSSNHALSNFKTVFCFHNSTRQINIVNFAMSLVTEILNLSRIDIAQ